MTFSLARFTARAGMAAIFLWSGFSKLAALEGTAGYIASMGLPLPYPAALGAAALELGAGALLLIGVRLVWSAFALAAFTVLTALIFHRAVGDQNELIHFMKNLSIAGGLVYLALAEQALAANPQISASRDYGAGHAR